MKITELHDAQGNTKRIMFRKKLADYRGPAASFPYDTYKALGCVQLVLGVCMLIIGIVHATISSQDRKILLLCGSAAIWCPLMPIAAGVIGVLLCKRRYWEVECLNTAYIIASSFSAAFMIVLILITIFLEFYYYGVLDEQPEELFDDMGRRGEDVDEGYTAMVCLLLVFAVLELLFAVASSLVGCCCAPIYEPDKGQQFQIIKRPLAMEEVPQPRPQVPVTQPKVQPMMQPVVQPAQSVILDEAQLQPVQLIYQEQPALQMVEPAPSLMYLPAPSVLRY